MSNRNDPYPDLDDVEACACPAADDGRVVQVRIDGFEFALSRDGAVELMTQIGWSVHELALGDTVRPAGPQPDVEVTQ
jgi:hypothetical protein